MLAFTVDTKYNNMPVFSSERFGKISKPKHKLWENIRAAFKILTCRLYAAALLTRR